MKRLMVLIVVFLLLISPIHLKADEPSLVDAWRQALDQEATKAAPPGVQMDVRSLGEHWGLRNWKIPEGDIWDVASKMKEEAGFGVTLRRGLDVDDYLGVAITLSIVGRTAREWKQGNLTIPRAQNPDNDPFYPPREPPYNVDPNKIGEGWYIYTPRSWEESRQDLDYVLSVVWESWRGGRNPAFHPPEQRNWPGFSTFGEKLYTILTTGMVPFTPGPVTSPTPSATPAGTGIPNPTSTPTPTTNPTITTTPTPIHGDCLTRLEKALRERNASLALALGFALMMIGGFIVTQDRGRFPGIMALITGIVVIVADAFWFFDLLK